MWDVILNHEDGNDLLLRNDGALENHGRRSASAASIVILSLPIS